MRDDDSAGAGAGSGAEPGHGAGNGDRGGAAEAGGPAWELLAPGVSRRRLPHLDVTVGLVVGTEGALLVDTGSTLREGAELRAQAEALAGRPVTHVVLTHGHFDHVYGAAAFPDAAVYGHRALDGYLRREGDALRADAVEHGTDPAEAAEAAAALRHPTHLVADRLALDLGRRPVLLAHPGAGHTDHDLVVHVPGATPGDPAVVFCGDLVEESGPPQAGPDSVPPAWPAALDAILALGGETARYVPGHGAVVGAPFVRRSRGDLTP